MEFQLHTAETNPITASWHGALLVISNDEDEQINTLVLKELQNQQAWKLQKEMKFSKSGWMAKFKW